MRSSSTNLILAMVFALGTAMGCSAEINKPDASGKTQRESTKRTSQESYESAASKYVHLHDFVSEEQKLLSDESWDVPETRIEIYPLDGGGMDNYLSGANADNSYYFETMRKTELQGDLRAILDEIAQRWSKSGWRVREFTSSYSGNARVTAITDEGYWIAADESDNRLYLTAHTPPYWGEYLPLADDIHERYEAEKARGEHARYDIGEDEHLSLMPGDYRPFPSWEAVP